MEERLRIVLWTLAGGGFCGAVGLWFGALAAAMAWRHGQAGGGRLGRAVADAFTRLRRFARTRYTPRYSDRMLPAFIFEARPVIPIEDAVRVELEFIAFRDGLKAK